MSFLASATGMTAPLRRTATGVALRCLGQSATPALSAPRRQPPRRNMSVVVLSDESAVEKFRMINNKSVLYFTATWCPPCKAIAPVYEEMSKQHPEVAFGKVDVDDNSDAALDFEVSAVPTFVLFEGEKAVDKFSGADQNKLLKAVEDLKARE